MEEKRENASFLLNEKIMKDIWKKLKELYDLNPTLFGILLFLD